MHFKNYYKTKVSSMITKQSPDFLIEVKITVIKGKQMQDFNFSTTDNLIQYDRLIQVLL